MHMICSLKTNITFLFSKSIHTQTTFPLFPPRIEPNTNDAWCPPFVHVACTSYLPSLFFLHWRAAIFRRAAPKFTFTRYVPRKKIYFLFAFYFPHNNTLSHRPRESRENCAWELSPKWESCSSIFSSRELSRCTKGEWSEEPVVAVVVWVWCGAIGKKGWKHEHESTIGKNTTKQWKSSLVGIWMAINFPRKPHIFIAFQTADERWGGVVMERVWRSVSSWLT